MKYRVSERSGPFSHTDETDRLRNRTELFKRKTGFHGGTHLTFVTPYGVKRNKHRNLVQSEVTMDDLFKS